MRRTLSALALFLAVGAVMARAQAPTTQVVGIGAAICMEFAENLKSSRGRKDS